MARVDAVHVPVVVDGGGEAREELLELRELFAEVCKEARDLRMEIMTIRREREALKNAYVNSRGEGDA
jgi:hypothetical protein